MFAIIITLRIIDSLCGIAFYLYSLQLFENKSQPYQPTAQNVIARLISIRFSVFLRALEYIIIIRYHWFEHLFLYQDSFLFTHSIYKLHIFKCFYHKININYVEHSIAHEIQFNYSWNSLKNISCVFFSRYYISRWENLFDSATT